MPDNEFAPSRPLGVGPYLAEVTNHLDSTYMGGLEVILINDLATPTIYNQSRTFPVSYLSPFYGVTGARFEGNNSGDFNDVQKSYGMWMVPPDVGTKVLVIFPVGAGEGYWIGCVQDKFQNHMVPGIAASQNVAMTTEQERKYGTRYLPVGEVLRKTQDGNDQKTSSLPKPVHPFADRLLAQGLVLDTIRGVTSSSARREIPSTVFGISTPGPVDTSNGAPRKKIGYDGERLFPVSRLGGSTFVMDDGDSTGQNELVRIRTRTGHQILLHNSSDLIYIANAQGTAWLEMTSAGKIDIYAQDSVSIHSEVDFNFLADRDINFEAGRNLNIKSNRDTNINVSGTYNLLVLQDGKLGFNGAYNQTVKGDTNLLTGGDFNLSASGNIGLVGTSNYFTAQGNTNIFSGAMHMETAALIHMNGIPATPATPATPDKPDPLATFKLPRTSSDAGWSDGVFYKNGDVISIMSRAPMHEPWAQHENINPSQFGSSATDVQAGSTAAARENQLPSANSAVPVTPASIPADWTKDEEFIKKVQSVAAKLRVSPTDLLACMAFETGRTFNPSLRNRIGATGLIQFIPKTAIGLGTTTDYLASLTRAQQMDWVEKYFMNGPLPKVANPTLEDLYMAIIWPAAVGQKNDYIMWRAGSIQYQQNPLDVGGKGYITKADAASYVRNQVAYVSSQYATIPTSQKMA
jgi:hypothetical protein